MLRYSAFGLLLVLTIAGCGINEITVEIKGGDDRLLRLDADDLEFKFNRLVTAGTYSFKEGLKSGKYRASVVAGSYLETVEIELEPAPITGVDSYPIVFEIPSGRNSGFERTGTIVYASTKSSPRNWDIFAIRADGTEQRQLTDTAANEQHPEWSPDGKRVAFTRGEVVTNFDIYVTNEDGGDEVRLTEHKARDERAVWSPDGASIAFVSQRDGDVAIWLMDEDGGNQRKLALGREPAWSPDGGKIAFVSSDYHDNDEIYVVNLDGTNRTRLTNQNKFDWFPSWSPDGSRILFCSEQFGGQELMMMTANGTKKTRLTTAEKTYEEEPAWSPDGKGVAYHGKIEQDYDIYLMDTAGFDLDDVETPPVLPINLTDNDDREDRSPSWRSY